MGKTKIIAKNQKSRKIKVQTPKILKSQELKKPQNPLKNFITSLKISLLKPSFKPYSQILKNIRTAFLKKNKKTKKAGTRFPEKKLKNENNQKQ